MVYYRKYRPQLIEDLDSAALRDTLQALLQKNTPHAFLFTGPKGLGKTSTARILAKAINCTQKKKGQIEPCNACEQCLSITNNTNVDILEIDAASNRGIDEIRDLKEKIRLSPVSAQKKVYIIDEVHMLTTEAFNALLKTLEEPPAHAMFILCTTEPQKVPSTILSRCFHIAFHLATKEELLRSFRRIVTSEHIAISDDALELIAQLADGGFRDGVKLLEESIALANGEEVTKAFLEKKFQVSAIAFSVTRLIESLQKKDVTQGLRIVAELVALGVDMKYFLQQVITTLHADLLVQVTTKQTEKGGLHLAELQQVFSLLSKAYIETKYAVLPQLPLELAILEWGNVGFVPNIPHEELVPSGQVTVSSLRKQVSDLKRKQVLYGEKVAPVQQKETKQPTSPSTVTLTQTAGDGSVTAEWLDHFWKHFIQEIKQHNHTVAGLLRGCSIKQFTKELLIIQTQYKFHKEKLEDAKTYEVLLASAKILTGNKMKIEIELKGK